MTRDYSKGKIYKIVVDTEEEYAPYIGSTTKEYLSQRMVFHRQAYQQWKNGKNHYRSSFVLFERFGVDKCQIILIENYTCSSKDELESRERYWYDEIKNCNKTKPRLTTEEITNIGKLRYQRRLELHPEDNREKYQKEICKNPNYHREQYQKCKEKKLQKITCECGKTMSYNTIPKHKKTKGHQNFLSTL